MPSGFENDPHSQDGQACPRNYFGITSYTELKAIEAVYVPKRALELRIDGMQGAFDTAHLQKIHWYLFRDVFPWAGELRMVRLSKVGGALFANPTYIERVLASLFGELKSESYVRGTDAASFVKRAAYYLGAINATHPFREGNGRSQREFLRQLGVQAGHRLSWVDLDEQAKKEASILSHTRRDNSGLERILEGALRGN